MTRLRRPVADYRSNRGANVPRSRVKTGGHRWAPVEGHAGVFQCTRAQCTAIYTRDQLGGRGTAARVRRRYWVSESAWWNGGARDAMRHEPVCLAVRTRGRARYRHTFRDGVALWPWEQPRRMRFSASSAFDDRAHHGHASQGAALRARVAVPMVRAAPPLRVAQGAPRRARLRWRARWCVPREAQAMTAHTADVGRRFQRVRSKVHDLRASARVHGDGRCTRCGIRFRTRPRDPGVEDGESAPLVRQWWMGPTERWVDKEPACVPAMREARSSDEPRAAAQMEAP